MKMRWKLYLNIRQKVIFGLMLGIMAVALVGGLSFRYLKEIERKQHLVEVADDLNNVILEIRRYEKNFLLYGSEQDFTENRLYIEKGLRTILTIVPEISSRNFWHTDPPWIKLKNAAASTRDPAIRKSKTDCGSRGKNSWTFLINWSPMNASAY
jgi:hypothetical protein